MYTNAQIADSLNLWNEYFNTSSMMTDEDFHGMTFDERLEMINSAYPEEKERSECNS